MPLRTGPYSKSIMSVTTPNGAFSVEFRNEEVWTRKDGSYHYVGTAFTPGNMTEADKCEAIRQRVEHLVKCASPS